ncbi:MAG: DUF1801 domain-containing protein [Bacteroidia bacterium]
MQIQAANVADYLSQVEDSKREGITKLIEIIRASIPKGFEERINYSMPSWVVPHSIFPPGYHCDPKLPLPFASIAAQKNFIAVYHMGIYADPKLLDWFVSEHKKRSSKKLDMGKSCIRYKKAEDIPYDLIGELFAKMTAQEWIDLYSKNYDTARNSKKK